MAVAAPAGAALGDDGPLARADKVVRAAVGLDEDLRPGRHGISSSSPSAPWRCEPWPCPPRLRLEVRAPPEMLEVAVGVVADEHDVAAAAAVTAVGSALGHVRLAAEAHAAVAAAPGLNVDSCSVFHSSVPPRAGPPSPRIAFARAHGLVRARPTPEEVSAVVSLLEDFKKFLLKGNLVTLAVAFVIAIVFACARQGVHRRHHHPDHRVDLRQAELRDAVVHDQLKPLLLRRLHQRGDHVRDDRVRGLLLRREALRGVSVAQGRPSVKDCPECTSEIPVGANGAPSAPRYSWPC